MSKKIFSKIINKKKKIIMGKKPKNEQVNCKINKIISKMCKNYYKILNYLGKQKLTKFVQVSFNKPRC